MCQEQGSLHPIFNRNEKRLNLIYETYYWQGDYKTV